VSNISLGGVRIFSDEYIKVGKRLEIEFFLPNGFSVTALSKVVWIEEQRSDENGLYEVGLEFIEIQPHALQELEKVLSEEE
jgi:hypothetical protein